MTETRFSLEWLQKLLTVISSFVGISYAVGFVIVNSYLFAYYRVLNLDLLRARYLAAGMAFLILFAFLLAAGYSYRLMFIQAWDRLIARVLSFPQFVDQTFHWEIALFQLDTRIQGIERFISSSKQRPALRYALLLAVLLGLVVTAWEPIILMVFVSLIGLGLFITTIPIDYCPLEMRQGLRQILLGVFYLRAKKINRGVYLWATGYVRKIATNLAERRWRRLIRDVLLALILLLVLLRIFWKLPERLLLLVIMILGPILVFFLFYILMYGLLFFLPRLVGLLSTSVAVMASYRLLQRISESPSWLPNLYRRLPMLMEWWQHRASFDVYSNLYGPTVIDLFFSNVGGIVAVAIIILMMSFFRFVSMGYLRLGFFLVIVILMAILYSWYIYPTLSPAIGGGIPSVVRLAWDTDKLAIADALSIKLSSDNISPEVYLVDQTSGGYIVVLASGQVTSQGVAIFIAKDLVKAVVYSQ